MMLMTLPKEPENIFPNDDIAKRTRKGSGIRATWSGEDRRRNLEKTLTTTSSQHPAELQARRCGRRGVDFIMLGTATTLRRHHSSRR